MHNQESFKPLFDALYAEYTKAAGVSRKRLQSYIVHTNFSAELPRVSQSDRISSRNVLSACLPVMQCLCNEPENGWLFYTYEVLSAGLFPYAGQPQPVKAQRQAMDFFLFVFSWFLDQENKRRPFDPLSDLYFATEEEVEKSWIRSQYEILKTQIQSVHFRELLRIGRDIMPFDPASHTIGVHHVAVYAARQAALSGLPVDVALVSAAAMTHDIGKFGCRGEDARRIPYFHYYYTWQWLTERNMPDIAHVAANHSTWDLEFENLPIESLLLIYADFRVRGEQNNVKQVRIYTLQEAYGIVFSKLANMTKEKEQSYRTVFLKLQDFERYLQKNGVDTSLSSDAPLHPEIKDAALCTPDEALNALRSMVFDNNMWLMHTITANDSFDELLEQARNEKNLQQIRTYLSLFEEYSVYMARTHKILTLKFLYELLMHHEGDVRRHAGCIMGAILANSGPHYRKELPAAAAAAGDIAPAMYDTLRESSALWEEYLELCLHPDYKISSKHAMRISNSLKTITSSLFSNCAPEECRQYWLPLYRRILTCHPSNLFVLINSLAYVPPLIIEQEEIRALIPVLSSALSSREVSVRICTLRALSALSSSAGFPHSEMDKVVVLPFAADPASLYLANRIRQAEGFAPLAIPKFSVSEIYLANLKSSVHWMVKLAHIDWLSEHVADHAEDAFHIAMHLSNLLSVSEHLPVRERAGQALVEIASFLSIDQCNEIVVDLIRELETGQNEISSYIPPFLGQLICRMPKKEMDENIDFLDGLLRISNTRSTRAVLSTFCAVLSLHTDKDSHLAQRVSGLFLSGISHFDNRIHLTALEILCRDFFGNSHVPLEARRVSFLNMGKKLLTLLFEKREGQLLSFSQAAMLNHLYRFITQCEVELNGFPFPEPLPVAFFPGTFDPFSAGHKRIVEEICRHGFEVYLAIDEFSWSKRTLPKLQRREIVNMSVSNLWNVYLFPDDIPINIAVPKDLRHLRELFAGREMYLVAGSDVIQNASAYESTEEGSAAYYDHILFSRVDSNRPGGNRRMHGILKGKVLTLSLPAYYESASSTQIREYIDKDMEITMLVAPMVQEFIYSRGLYLRTPQYKRKFKPKDRYLTLQKEDHTYTVRYLDLSTGNELGRIHGRSIGVAELYEALGNYRTAEYVRLNASGRILFIDQVVAEGEEILFPLFNDLLARCVAEDHTYALYRYGPEKDEMPMLLEQMGFSPVLGQGDLLYVDMRAPLVLSQDALQQIKEPLHSDPVIQAAVLANRPALRRAIANMFPGKLLLFFDSELLNTALLKKVQICNSVWGMEDGDRKLGRSICVPYGKVLSDTLVPHTVTKALHADKMFYSDMTGFDITEAPGYSLLINQIKTLKSFRRPILLVDDLLHNGYRLEKLDPLFKQEGLEVDRIIVSILSGRGRDLMKMQGREVECEYFIPNLRYWFTESLLYPFIGGDSVSDRSRERDLLPSINLILPYEYPLFLKEVGYSVIRNFSMASLKNALYILTALEERYQENFGTSLTIKRLGEAIFTPRLPDKGAHMQYDLNVAASAYLKDDILLMQRLSRERNNL